MIPMLQKREIWFSLCHLSLASASKTQTFMHLSERGRGSSVLAVVAMNNKKESAEGSAKSAQLFRQREVGTQLNTWAGCFLGNS